MYLTAHASVGLLIGKFIPLPGLSFLIGLFSHFILDFIPHDLYIFKRWLNNNKNYKQDLLKHLLFGLVDAFISVLLIFYLIYNFDFKLTLAMVTAIIGSWLPDFFFFLRSIKICDLKILNKPHYFANHWADNYFNQHKNFITKNLPFLVQIIIIIIVIIIII